MHRSLPLNAKRCFMIFCFLHILFWTLASWLENLTVRAGQAEYYQPELQEFIVMLLTFFWAPKTQQIIGRFNWVYLFFMGLGPFILVLFLSLITGNYLYTNWGVSGGAKARIDGEGNWL